ncbi:hypothetical protein ZIOFF_044464 [Zingiber officinale]|uniref:WW domain-containing protein n=1 Tax=Zingiber officinale TaxID=94328 RepID=A0A8J5FYK2_ZINOF|nr:hypothetical protein ZIOFF_044464 [Zingiber officinale]
MIGGGSAQGSPQQWAPANEGFGSGEKWLSKEEGKNCEEGGMATSSVPNSPPSKRPRYAPPDPTLPSPWRALIDGSTDYLYYWNPETKVTQYERPVSEDPPLTLVASQLRPGVSSSMQQPKQQSPLDVPEENVNQNPCQYVGSRSIGNPSIIDSTEFVQEPSIVKHHKQSSAKSGPTASTAEAYRRSTTDSPALPVVLATCASFETIQSNIMEDEAVKFGKSSRISCVCLYGGAKKGPQLRELDRGADIIVATPGHLNDILNVIDEHFSF